MFSPQITSVEGSRVRKLKTTAVIPAAGTGIRMGGDRAKQFLELGGRPLLAVTLRPFQDCVSIEAIVLVVPADDVAYCRREIVEKFRLDKVRKVVPGGSKRQDSVRLGIEATEWDCDLILIHDGVRPLVDVPLIERVIDAASAHGAVTAGLPAKDTVKEVDAGGLIIGTYDRQQVWLIQTPQAFRYKDIAEAHRRALTEGQGATDDALLMERMGIPVRVVEGSERNIKVTTPHDLELARFLLGKGD